VKKIYFVKISIYKFEEILECYNPINPSKPKDHMYVANAQNDMYKRAEFKSTYSSQPRGMKTSAMRSYRGAGPQNVSITRPRSSRKSKRRLRKQFDLEC